MSWGGFVIGRFVLGWVCSGEGIPGICMSWGGFVIGVGFSWCGFVLGRVVWDGFVWGGSVLGGFFWVGFVLRVCVWVLFVLGESVWGWFVLGGCFWVGFVGLPLNVYLFKDLETDCLSPTPLSSVPSQHLCQFLYSLVFTFCS